MILLCSGKGFTFIQKTSYKDTFEIAWTFYLQEQWDSALYYWRLLPQEHNQNPIAQYYSAKTYFKKQDYSEAYVIIKKLINKSEYRKEYWELKMEIEENLALYKNYKKSAYFLLEKENNNSIYFHNLLLAYRLTKLTRMDKEFLIENLPLSSNSLNRLALLILVDNNLDEKALFLIDYLIQKNPDDLHYYFLKHSLFEHLGENEKAYQWLQKMFHDFPEFVEVSNTLFLHSISRDDIRTAKEIIDRMNNQKIVLKNIYTLWDYIILNPELSKEWNQLFASSLMQVLNRIDENQVEEKIKEYILAVFNKGYTQIFLKTSSKYLANFPLDYNFRSFYLKVLEREKDKNFESELFVAISYFPQNWELYEWAIDFYKKEGRFEDMKEMQEALKLEKIDQDENK